MGGGVLEYLSGDVLWFQREALWEKGEAEIFWVNVWTDFSCRSLISGVRQKPCSNVFQPFEEWYSSHAFDHLVSFESPGSVFIEEAKEGESETALLPCPALSLPSLAETVPIRKDVCALVTKSLQIESLSKGKCRTILQINLGTREYRPCVKLGRPW